MFYIYLCPFTGAVFFHTDSGYCIVSSFQPKGFLLFLSFFFFLSIYLFTYLFIWLCWVLVAARGLRSCGMQTPSCGTHVGSSSLTRDRTQAPCIGSVAESYHCATRKVPLLFPIRAGLLAMNYLSFCLSENILIFPLYLKNSFVK